MKKIFFILLMTMFSFYINNSQVFANEIIFCAQKPYPISSETGKNISKYTGSTFLSEKLIEKTIQKALEKNFGGFFQTKLETFSLLDSIQGKFKSINIYGKSLKIKDFYISSFQAKTLCNYNHIKLKNKKAYFVQELPAEFNAQINKFDLQKTMSSSQYLKNLKEKNVSFKNVTFLNIKKASATIKNDKLYFILTIGSIMNQEINIILQSSIEAKDGKAKISDLKLMSFNKTLNLSLLSNYLNEINPLSFIIKNLSNQKTNISVKNINIINDKINISGNVIFKKSE